MHSEIKLMTRINAVISSLLLATALPCAAQTTWVVSSTNDSGFGSLRQAISDAASGDTIIFTNTLSGQTIVLISGQLAVNKNITIDASALPGGIAIDGNGANRIFRYESGSINVLTGLTLTNGYTSGHGGAIYLNTSAVLTINGSTLSGNSADGWGGTICNYRGTLMLNNSTLNGNSASIGGGVFSLTGNIANTPISTKTALSQCTLVNNSATSEGGAIENGNGWTFMTNCTVTGNTCPYGAGVYSYGDGNTETVVANSIIAGNLGGFDLELSETSNPHAFLSIGHNLVGNGYVDYFTATGDATNHTASSIQLAPLGDYGGPTPTMPPLPGSPAIDAGGTTTVFATDQRGYSRLSGSAVDIGAVELQQFPTLVQNTNDSGFGSLRQAIAVASSGDTITFTNTLSGQTITLTGGQLVMTNNLTIDATALPGGIAIDGNGVSRIFTFASGTTNILTGLNLTNGYSSDEGGGIYLNSSAVLTINDSTLSGNSVNGWGGAIYNDHGTLVLNNSTLSDNSANNRLGGGIYNANGTIALDNSILSDNSADAGGGIYSVNGTIALDNSTLNGNSTTDSGGGIYNANGTITLDNCTLNGNSAMYGGGIYNDKTLTLNNCTLRGNSAQQGGGIYSSTTPITSTPITSSTALNQCTLANNTANYEGGAVYNYNGWTFIANCTITGNSATDGSGAWTYGDPYCETVVANSIIAGNTGGNDLGLHATSNPDAFLSAGHNLVGKGDTGYFTATGDAVNHTASSIQLAPLGDYGGPTQTMPPLPGSPAIDAGGTTTAFDTDQRGYPRLSGSAVDIGPVEFQYPVIIVRNTNDAGVGSLRQAIAVASSGDTIMFTNSLSGQSIVLTNGQVIVDKNLTIDASALPDGIIIDGSGTDRIFTFNSGTTNFLTGLTLINGYPSGNGGAIYLSNSAVLTINDSTLSGNSVNNWNYWGGAIYNDSGTLTLNNCTLSGSSAFYGGGVYNNYGTLTLNDSIISGNAADNGGGFYNGEGTLTLNSCTLSGNTAGYGGGFYNEYGTLTLNNSTFNGNSANYRGGGIYSYTDDIDSTPITSCSILNQCTLKGNSATTHGGAIYNQNGWTFMTNCTLTGNTALTGAGAWTYGDNFTETVVANSIIAGNSGGSDLGFEETSNPEGFLSIGNNLIGNGDVGYFTATGDATGHTAASLQLASLGEYGGPVQTMPPLPGSPAIDAGGSTTAFATDQRGYPRVINGTVDIGACESFYVTDSHSSAAGFSLEWMSLPAGWNSVVKYSTNLVTMPFTDLSVPMPYLMNSYTDLVYGAGNACFYKVEIQP